MTTSPIQLLRFGVRARTREHAVDRALLRLKGKRHTNHQANDGSRRAEKDKSATLRIMCAMQASGAICEAGRPRKEVRKRTQSQLAGFIGYKSASSVSRNLHAAIPVVATKKGFAGGLTYFRSTPEGNRPDKVSKSCYWPASTAVLEKHKDFGQYITEDSGEASGYDRVPGWINDPCAPFSPNTRVVLTYLATRGMFRTNKSGKLTHPELIVALETIGSITGLSVDAVRDALRSVSSWKDKEGQEHTGIVSIIQIVRQPGQYELDGRKVTKNTQGCSWKQAPNKLVYIGDRPFDIEKASDETRRLLAIARRQHITESEWWQLIAKIHEETLKEWIGTKKLIHTFHAEFERRIRKRGVPANIIDQLIERPPS